MFDFFKQNKKEQPYNYEAALVALSNICRNTKAYSFVMPSVYYDVTKKRFVVHFECVMREYFQKNGRNKFFFSLRRSEKIFGENLQDVLDFAITYAGYEDAFIRSPQDNLPDGISMSIKNISRVPNEKPSTFLRCKM